MIVEKDIVAVGMHHTKSGRFHATPARLRRQAETFKAMKAAGLKIPVAWAHQPSAIPSLEGMTGDAAKYNAGYFDDLTYDEETGRLRAKLDLPGAKRLDPNGAIVFDATLPDGRTVESAISEVSISARDQFKDGAGRIWSDSILHAALTPLPVWAGQDGFKDAEPVGRETRLSLATLLYELATDQVETDPKAKKKKPPFEKGEDADGDGKTADGTPEEKPAVDENGKPKEEGAAGETEEEAKAEDAAGQMNVAKSIELLAKLPDAVILPKDTNPKNFIERLNVALLQLTTTDETLNGGQPEKPAPAPRDMLMSLLNHADPAIAAMAKREQARLAKDEVAAREAIKNRIGALLKRGLPKARHDVLLAEANTVELSLSGDAFASPLADRVAEIELALPSEQEFAARYESANVIAEPAPHVGTGMSEKRSEEIGESVAKKAGIR